MYVKIRARSCQGLIGQMFRTMTLSAEKQPELLQDLRASDPRTVANAFHELPVLDRRPELSRISAPVTVLSVQSPQAHALLRSSTHR